MEYDVKEQTINEVKSAMATILDRQQLDYLTYTLSKSFINKKIIIEENLPSTDILDNEKLIEMFLINKKIEGLTKRTIEQYRYSIKKFCYEVNMSLLKVDTNTIRLYLLKCAKTQNNITVDNTRRYLNSIFSWLEDEQYIVSNPVKKIKRIKCEKKIKTPLTPLEVEKIRDCCVNDRETALIDLLCSTGIRCEEITKIKLEDCNFDKKTIKIHGKGAKERLVYMSEKCRLHLVQYLNNREYNSEYLFCNVKGNHDRLHNSGITSIMRDLGLRADVNNCQVHRFRKYFATTLLLRGCDIVYIKTLLGHEKIDTTLIYAQATDDKVRSQFEQYADM